MSLREVSVFDPSVPPLLRTAALWEMAFFIARVAFEEQLHALRLPRPGAIITLLAPVLDENGDELPAGLDVVALECEGVGSILCSAELGGEEVSVWVHPGEWYQPAGER